MSRFELFRFGGTLLRTQPRTAINARSRGPTSAGMYLQRKQVIPTQYLPPTTRSFYPSPPHAQHKLTRMRRVMRELDRIYFQPLFQKKFRCFIKFKRGKSKRSDKKNTKRKSTNSFEIATNSQIHRLQGGAETGDGVNRKSYIYEEIFQDAHDGTSHENVAMTSPGCDSVTNESDERAFLSAEGEDSKQDCRKIAQKPQTSKKKIKETPLVQRPTVSRKLRTWLAERKIYILRRKQKVKSLQLIFNVRRRFNKLDRQKSKELSTYFL